VSNGKAGAAAILPDTSLPAADNAPLIASGQSMSDRRHHVPPLSL